MRPPTPLLLAALEDRLGPVATLSRTPSPARSTAGLEDLQVELADGTGRRLVLKHGGRDTPREAAVYRDALRGADLGTPELVCTDGAGWLVLAAVDAPPLWQSEGTGDWCRTAVALARTHRVLAGSRCGRAAGTAWRQQLGRAAAREPRVVALGSAYARAVAEVEAAPTTLVHGEAFPANVLVTADGACLVDWETAGRGCALLDLAALTAGWDDDAAAEIAGAYGGDLRLLPAARLLVAVRWLGEPAGSTDWWALARDAAAAA